MANRAVRARRIAMTEKATTLSAIILNVDRRRRLTGTRPHSPACAMLLTKGSRAATRGRGCAPPLLPRWRSGPCAPRRLHGSGRPAHRRNCCCRGSNTSSDARLSTVSWVAVAFLLTMAGFLPIFGRSADMVGRKLLYTGGFLLFVLGSALCGSAPDLTVLIAARVSSRRSGSTPCFERRRYCRDGRGAEYRGQALGIQAAAQAVGLSTGPVIGGFLLDTLGWVILCRYRVLDMAPIRLPSGGWCCHCQHSADPNIARMVGVGRGH